MARSTLRPRLVIPVVAIVVPVLLTFLALEIALRASGVRSPVIHAEMYRINENHSLLPYSLQPGYVGDYAGGAVRVDNNGNRVVPLPPGDQEVFAYHTVILGDSIAFGQGLNDSETIAANLQNILADSGEPTRITLLSAPGYTSWNEYAIFHKQHKLLTEIDKLVLIYVRNDITLDNDHFDFGIHGAKVHYMTDTWSRRFRMILYDNSRVAALILNSIRQILYYVNPSDAPMTIRHEDNWTLSLDYSMKAIGKIKDMCLQHDIEFWIAIYRDHHYYGDMEGVLNDEKAISAELENIGVRYFVLDRVTSVLSEDESKVSWYDGHPSPGAARVIALQIAETTNDNYKGGL